MCDSMVFRDDLLLYIRVECVNNYEDGFGYIRKEFEEILRILYERRELFFGIGRGFIIEKFI